MSKCMYSRSAVRITTLNVVSVVHPQALKGLVMRIPGNWPNRTLTQMVYQLQVK